MTLLFHCSLNDFHKTQFIITTVLFTLGLFGNISIILALRGLKSITSILTIYLAIIDTLSLMSKDIADGLIYLNTENFGTLYCVEWHIPVNVFVLLGNWILVLLCTERFILIFSPFLYRSMVTTRRVHVTMATMLIIFVVFSVVLHFTTTSDDSLNQCMMLNISVNVRSIIMFVLVYIAPILLTSVLTASVIAKLHFCRQKFVHVSKSNIRQKLEGSLSRIMLSTAILFVTLTFPGTIYFCLIWPTLDYQGVNTVLDITLTLFIDSTHILNFVAYLIFVEPFRKSFRRIMTRGPM